jgi:Tfp pilus assembly protein PilF
MQALKRLFEKRWTVPLLFLLLALGLRLGYLTEVRNSMLFDVLLIDSHTYDQFAMRILDGTFRGEEVYSMNILYPYFLAAIYAVAGNNWPAVAVVQAVIDAASCLLIYLIGRALFGRRVALIALALSSVYGVFIFYSGALLTPALINLLLLAMLYLIARYMDSRRPWLLLASGALCGVASLGRGNAILLIPLYLIASRLLESRWKAALSRWAILAIAGVAVIIGVTIRNYTVEGEFVPIAGNYAAFYIGNNETATGLYSGLPFIAGASFEDEVVATRDAVGEIVGHEVTLGEAANYLFKSGIVYVLKNPGGTLKLALLKAFYFFNSTESPTNLNYHFAREFSRILRMLAIDFGVIASLGILGIIVTLREWRRYVFLYLYIATFFVTCLLFFVSAEYRMPAVPVFILFASAAIWWCYERVRRLVSRTRRQTDGEAGGGRLLMFAIGLVVLLIFTHVRTDLLEKQTLTRLDHLNYASLYQRRGDYARAIELAKQSLMIDPHYGLAHVKLYQLYNAVGDYQLAYHHLEESLKYRPVPAGAGRQLEAETALRRANAAYLAGSYEHALSLFQRLLPETTYVEPARVLNNIGLCHARLGDRARAEEAYKRAIEIDPGYSKAYSNLATLYRDTGDLELAAANYRKALEIQPMFTAARINFAGMYRMAGETDAARAQLEQILTYDPGNQDVLRLLRQLE